MGVSENPGSNTNLKHQGSYHEGYPQKGPLIHRNSHIEPSWNLQNQKASGLRAALSERAHVVQRVRHFVAGEEHGLQGFTRPRGITGFYGICGRLKNYLSSGAVFVIQL